MAYPFVLTKTTPKTIFFIKFTTLLLYHIFCGEKVELFLAFQIAHKIVCQINNNPFLPFQLVERIQNNLTKRRGSFGISPHQADGKGFVPAVSTRCAHRERGAQGRPWLERSTRVAWHAGQS
jgi:hypothetical protein